MEEEEPVVIEDWEGVWNEANKGEGKTKKE